MDIRTAALFGGVSVVLIAATPPSGPNAHPEIVTTGQARPDMVDTGRARPAMVTRGRRIDRMTWEPARHPEDVRFNPDPDAPAPSGMLAFDLEGIFLPRPVGLSGPIPIRFPRHETKLTDEAEARLREVATTLKENVEVQVVIRAVADSEARADVTTATLRVDAVADMLENVEIDPGRIAREVLLEPPERARTPNVLELRAL